jgi:hypothetical protein
MGRMEEERLQILRMLEAGQIDAGEATRLLAAVEPTEPEVDESVLPPPNVAASRVAEHWAHFWIYPLMAGAVVLIVGALIMGLVSITGAARGWLVCGWFPLILGIVVVGLAWWSRQARWLHLRISEAGRRKVAFSFPLPLGLAAWGLRIAQPFVPQLAKTGVDDLVIALRDSATPDEPLFIDVQEEEDGERVQLYIG